MYVRTPLQFAASWQRYWRCTAPHLSVWTCSRRCIAKPRHLVRRQLGTERFGRSRSCRRWPWHLGMHPVVVRLYARKTSLGEDCCRLAIFKDVVEPMRCIVGFRDGQGHCHHVRQQARKEGLNELEPGRVQEHDTLTRRNVLSDDGSQLMCVGRELTVRQAALLYVTLKISVPKSVGAFAHSLLKAVRSSCELHGLVRAIFRSRYARVALSTLLRTSAPSNTCNLVRPWQALLSLDPTSRCRFVMQSGPIKIAIKYGMTAGCLIFES